MRLNFWGVRGSLPTADRHAWRYGGNTPCLEVRAGNQLLILDAGTGIRDLGHQLCTEFPDTGIEANLLLTHYHWDHVQGLPFFQPLYRAGDTIHISGPRPQAALCSSLRAVFQSLFRAPFFPVSADQLKGGYTLRELQSDSDFTLGDTRVRTCQLNHPQGALAYRLDQDGTSIVYVTDHEPGNAELDRALRILAAGADLLISDAQYHPEELAKDKAGWGHGSWQASVATALEAGVRNLILFHHEPLRSDEEVDLLLEKARRAFPNTWAAADGMFVDLDPNSIHFGCRGSRLSQRVPVDLRVGVETFPAGIPLRHDASLQSIGFHGAYLLSPHSYRLQEPLELVFALRAEDEHSKGAGNGQTSNQTVEFRLRGYVVRTDPQATGNGWVGIAVHFPPSPLMEASQPSHEQASRLRDACSAVPKESPAIPHR